MKRPVVNDAASLYLKHLGAKAVAESGIHSDMYHMGKLLLTSLRTNKEWTLQIDANTGEQESSTSVLSRSIRCARSMRRRGLDVGDVIVIIAPHHLDQCIPLYAANYIGVVVYPLDITLKTAEIKNAFNIGKPKLIFCQGEKLSEVEDALSELNMRTDIITYNESSDRTNFTDFLKECDNGEKEDDFKASNFDSTKSFSLILSTSGSTGLPKATPLTHMNFILGFPCAWSSYTEFPNLTRLLVASSLQWYTGIYLYFSAAIFGVSKIQTSAKFSAKNYFDMICKYKVTYMYGAPWVFNMIINEAKRTNTTLPNLEFVAMGGNTVSEDLLSTFSEIAPECTITRIYGMSEASGLMFHPCNFPPDSIGIPSGVNQIKLVDPETGAEVTEPFAHGELVTKGPAVFKGYYSNCKATEDVFTKDGWYKTGDLIYKDQYEFYYHAGRIKYLLQLTSGKMSPVEIEAVVRSHPGVCEAVVIGIPDENLIDLPVACVIKNGEPDVSAQQIIDLVKNNLSETKQLRGGVVFLEQFPRTVSMKIDINKLKGMVLKMKKEDKLI